ncbi:MULTISPECIES: IclR family transcriptional regulator C-terminal domain-containing protein [unclassified Streptomyces]|uniref:IclR family transcriptional regulator domain-containing protein n=1 Tax=unclassified Streptomyces TaxID=2593676 RepID=UPI002365B02F|nr:MULTISPECIES: IclR family transcriptional regulator C-terminal domain-containing protein [unclassified Streptomyces]MDF3140399.1 IclR family transcriptional regulator C-terminal domain-containing protein [Streptomyces sp. T21Q-yed]WDF38804.1 IclR family transcriptional regulator C-terminal domain-containing protein [Streptomyces sp. T12]
MPAKTTMDAARAVPAEAVTPLIRGVAVLRQLTEAGGTLSASGLERATGLARSTVDRIASTLARMGYVRLDGRDVVLAPRVMELGNAYLAALGLPALLSSHADALADELDESVSLAVVDRDGIRFIHQATRRRAMSLSFRIGDLLPAERTAPGPLFATEWTDAEWQAWRERRAADPQDRDFPAVPPREHASPDEDFERRAEHARKDGWALDDQLIEPGLVAVSVPVRDPRAGGRIACVANVVSHTSRHTAANLRDTLLPRLRAAVAKMERELREAPQPQPGAAPAGLAIWTGASKQELGREFVESLARGLTVLTAFGEGRAELTLTDVARATGLARATARRALITYEHLGLVRQSGNRGFTLTPRVLSLGYPPLSRTSLSQIATPHLAELADRVHESASLAVLTPSGQEIQYTARAATSRVMSVNITLGTRLPAYATSLGRVLLADTPAGERQLATPPGELRPLTPRTITDPETLATVLEDVRQRGYALVDEELEVGLRSVAVPVRDRTGRVVAAVNVAMHAARRSVQECVREVLPELVETAGRVEGDLRVAGRFTRVSVS